MGYKPIWQVIVTPVGGSPVDVSHYVSDMTAPGGGSLGGADSAPSGGGTAIDIQDSTTTQASTFTVQLWDYDDSGLLTQFGIGDQVEIWTDTRESASDIQASVELELYAGGSTAPISLPVKAWGTVS